MENEISNNQDTFFNDEQQENNSKEGIKRFSPEDMKYNLKKLFFNYGQFQLKDNEFFVSFQGMNKILRATGLIDSGLLKITDIDILLKKINSKSPRFNEKQFFDFFVLVSEKAAPKVFKKSRKLAFEAVYKDFLLPLCQSIDEKIVSADELNSGAFLFKAIEDFVNDYHDKEYHYIILNDIVNTFYEIYKAYFHYETNNYHDINKIVEGTLTNLLSFCREFEIVPYNVSFNHVVVYYNIMISRILVEKSQQEEKKEMLIKEGHNPDDYQDTSMMHKPKYLLKINKEKRESGNVFGFMNFLDFIIHMSELSFARLVYSSYSSMKGVERFLVFLEKLQGSKGFLNFERKTSRPHSIANTLVPEKKTIMKLDPGIIEDSKFGDPEVRVLKEKGKEIKEIHKHCAEEYYTISNVMGINEENLEMLEMKMPLLKDIFISYTGFNDKLSFMKLNYSSYLKFLKDSKLVDSGKEAEKLRTLNKSETGGLSSNVKNYNYRKSLFNFADSQKGKITETDASLIFQVLTGPKNKTKDFSKDELMNKK